MTDNKKTRERHFLDEFATIYPAFPAGKIVCHESPDFLIKQDTKIIGIEIVDYIRGQRKGESEERRNEVLRQEIVDKAKEKFEAKHKIPLITKFSWDKRYLLHQAEISDFADNVVSIIEKHIPILLCENVTIISDEFEDTLLEKVCHSITVWRVSNERQSVWNFMSSDRITVQPDEFQYLLDKKNSKVQDYLRVCDTVWLIIIADRPYISSHIDISSAAANNVYKSSFEQVFIYDRFSANVFPLRLQ